MSLRTVYQRFLEVPNPISLAPNASLHYITTLTTISESAAIVRHLETQNKNVVRTKHARVIAAIEGQNSLAVEVETVLEFISGGGTYLPGLENFIIDKIATIPTTHIVYFAADHKISQIRISWDQGSLLKQAEVIGSRGRNWPVYDGLDQVRLINSGSSAAPSVASEHPASPRGRSTNQSIVSSRSASPSKKYIKDPHASLDLFSPKTVDENDRLAGPNAVAPRASAKPPPREMSELFAAGHEDHAPGSPNKGPVSAVIAPKGRSNQKFAAPRLFSDERDEPAAVGYKSNPAKYNHFDLGDVLENDPMQFRETKATSDSKAAMPLRGKSGKHDSHWDFQDFTTPGKVGQKIRGQDVVHFSLDNAASNPETPAPRGANKPRRDNEAHFEFQDDGTPIERHAVPKPRKDAETHFQFKDTVTPAPNRNTGRPTSSAGDRNGLYKNNLYDEDGDESAQEKPPLATITNNKGRKNDFDSHWNMGADSPATGKTNNENNHGGGDHQKAAKMMDATWDNYDQTPEQDKKPAKQSQLRKGLESHWNHGDDEHSQPTTKKGFWDF